MLLSQGVYTLRAGPTFETAAECRALRTLGGDVVGMSTAYETAVARAVGLRVTCLSVVTNMQELNPEVDATPIGDAREPRSEAPSGAPRAAAPVEALLEKQVLSEGLRATERLALLIGRFLERLWLHNQETLHRIVPARVALAIRLARWPTHARSNVLVIT